MNCAAILRILAWVSFLAASDVDTILGSLLVPLISQSITLPSGK